MNERRGTDASATGAAAIWHRAVLLVALAGLVALGLAQLRTPESMPKTGPETEFSAERAMDDLRVLASESRAVGTPGHDKARAFLIEKIEGLGLKAELHETPIHARFPGSPGFSAGVVRNVVTRVEGTDSSGAIVVNAHYDSGTGGPGASDCGSCVVTALESLRAIVAGPPLENDVIFVFSDAEEEGDLGAAAFVRDHPWVEDVRLALNYEAQGSRGPAILYATSEQDGWIVSEFLDIAPYPSAYSWIGALIEVYPSGQLDCDLAEYLKRDIQGLGFVYTGDTVDYHTVLDSIENIDPGSVQQEGDYTVAFLRHFGDMPLDAPPREENLVFFNVLPGVVAHYSYTWAALFAGVVSLLALGLLVMGVRRGRLRIKSLAGAVAAVAAAGLVAVGLAALAWLGIRTANPTYDVILIGHYQTGIFTVAFVALSVALVGVFHAFARRLGTANLTAGAIVAWLPLLWLLTLSMPAMSYIATWPLAFALVPLAWLVLGSSEAGWRWVSALAIGAIPTIVLLPATLYQAVGLINRFEGALGMPIFGAMTLFVIPWLLLLLPHLDMLSGEAGEHRWWIPALAGATAVALIGWANVTFEYTSEQPRPNHIAYALDADDGDALWVSYDRHLDHWTSKFVGQDAQRGPYETAAWGTFEAFSAAAPTVDLTPPEVEIVDRSRSDDARVLRVRIRVPEQAREMRVAIDAPSELLSAELDGREMDLSEYQPARAGRLSINYVNVPAEGVELEFAVESSEPVDMIVEYSQLGLPDDPRLDVPERPADTMPAPSFGREATEVRKRFEL